MRGKARQGRKKKGEVEGKREGWEGEEEEESRGEGKGKRAGMNTGKQVYCDFLYLSHIGYLRNHRTLTRKYLSDNFSWMIG